MPSGEERSTARFTAEAQRRRQGSLREGPHAKRRTAVCRGPPVGALYSRATAGKGDHMGSALPDSGDGPHAQRRRAPMSRRGALRAPVDQLGASLAATVAAAGRARAGRPYGVSILSDGPHAKRGSRPAYGERPPPRRGPASGRFRSTMSKIDRRRPKPPTDRNKMGTCCSEIKGKARLGGRVVSGNYLYIFGNVWYFGAVRRARL